jgi:hypothetical protein
MEISMSLILNSNAATKNLPFNVVEAKKQDVPGLVLLSAANKSDLLDKEKRFTPQSAVLIHLTQLIEHCVDDNGYGKVLMLTDEDQQADAWVHVSERSSTDECLYIGADAGRPEARKELLTTVINMARGIGMKTVETTLNPKPDPFYANNGFKRKADTNRWVLAIDKA